MAGEGTEKRLTAVEVEIESVKQVISNFKLDIDTKFDSLFGVIKELRTEQSQLSKPHWQTYFGGMALILVVVGMIGSSYVRDQVRVEDEFHEMKQVFREHELGVGHSGVTHNRQLIMSLTDQVKHDFEELEQQIRDIRTIQPRRGK